MGRGLLVALLAAVVGGALAVSGTARTTGGGTPERATFRLADDSAGCAFDGRQLVCASRSASRTTVLRADGSSATRDGALSWSNATSVLRPTESWWHGGFSCRVQARLLVCRRADGSIAIRRNP